MSVTDGGPPRPTGTSQVDAQTLLQRVHDLIANAKPVPLSSTVRLESKEEVLELLEEAINRLPDELRAARWLLKERDEFLAKVQREGDDILEAARVRAEAMVQRTEVVRAAQHRARRIVEEADAEARRLRHEAEDYCDHRLAQFEIVLDRTIKTVQAGRAKLNATPPMDPHDDAQDEGEVGADEVFFDQDED
jgi:cell division septum initiation protein DivIVA